MPNLHDSLSIAKLRVEALMIENQQLQLEVTELNSANNNLSRLLSEANDARRETSNRVLELEALLAPAPETEPEASADTLPPAEEAEPEFPEMGA